MTIIKFILLELSSEFKFHKEKIIEEIKSNSNLSCSVITNIKIETYMKENIKILLYMILKYS